MSNQLLGLHLMVMWMLLKDMKEGVSATLVLAPTVAVEATTPNTAQKPMASPAVQQSLPDTVPVTFPMVATLMEVVPLNQKIIRANPYTLEICLGMQQWS